MQAEDKRWGEGRVNTAEWSFPALKATRALEGLERLTEGARFLDFGCGEGKLIATVHELHPGAVLAGADIRKPRAEAGYSFYLLPESAPTGAELPRASFDWVASLDVLEHVRDTDASLALIAASLKPGGTFSAFIPAEGQPLSFYRVYRFLMGQDVYVRTKDHRNALTRGEWLRRVEKHFEILEVSYSYHLLGSFLDATFFAMQVFKPLMNWWWNKNAYYRGAASGEARGGGALNGLMKLANAVCYWESRILKKVPWGASGVHLRATPRALGARGVSA